jgi:hypothetical protein
MSVVKRRSTARNKIVHLYTQADRARKIASECGSQLVAELLEDHARLCERNAQVRAGQAKGRPRAGGTVFPLAR